MYSKRAFYQIRAFDVGSILLSFLLATFLRFEKMKDFADKAMHYKMLPVIILAYVIITVVTQHKKRGRLEEAGRVVLLNLYFGCSVVFVYFMLHDANVIARSFLGLFMLIDTIFMLIIRALMRRHSEKKESVPSYILFADTDESAESAKRTLEKSKRRFKVSNTLVCKSSEAALKYIEECNIAPSEFDFAFLCAPSYEKEEIMKIIDAFETMGAVCYERLPDKMPSKYYCKVYQIGHYPVVEYNIHKYPSGMLAMKRVMDIMGGIVGCLLTLILTLILGPLIKLDSPGPVFFSQTRIGKNGRKFKIWKFRSMYKDAEARLSSLAGANKMDGLMFKMDNDPRITRVGRFIRKTSLDEFPQFWNVLKGDMSLVGTRPPTEKEFLQYDGYYRRRLSMTPGLTGAWQVSGRSEITNFDDVVALDLDYIDHWSLWLDIKIILKTVEVIFTGKGAE